MSSPMTKDSLTMHLLPELSAYDSVGAPPALKVDLSDRS